ncbi:hypothetical protein SKAU_G00389370 [Synaphobranchus kaupii]|uniref:G-protein coupled receptors family 1 profile domain-containing protein n=1 Tax=Synaphobranchus kaupii TaxID=118154 RepID=A0A9Q1ICM1_SYNKA|nr:hypothetical protein SKAU_G00389370 [Synaphobranchus kaupii]
MQHLNTSNQNSTSWNTKNVASSVVLGMCCVVGIPGNLLVAVAISRRLRRASLMVKLMLNLALTDILSLLMLPVWIVALLGDWPYSPAACKILSYAVYCGVYASVLTVTLMSIHRYLKVLYPSGTARLHLGWRGGKVLLASLWALSCFLATPAAVFREVKVEEAGSGRLACRPHYGSRVTEATILLLETLLLFLVPGAILTSSYLCIIHRVGRSPFPSSHRLNQLVTWVVAAFFIFWAPSHALNLVQAVAAIVERVEPGAELGARLREAARQGHNVAGAFTFLNSSLNPFLYAFASRSLRNTSSLMKRVEHLCHSKVPETAQLDYRKASLDIVSTNVTLDMTTERQNPRPAGGATAVQKELRKGERGVLWPVSTEQVLSGICAAPKFQITTGTDIACQQGPNHRRVLEHAVERQYSGTSATRLENTLSAREMMDRPYGGSGGIGRGSLSRDGRPVSGTTFSPSPPPPVPTAEQRRY